MHTTSFAHVAPGAQRVVKSGRSFRAVSAALFVALAVLVFAIQPAVAGKMRPYSVRGDKALVGTDTTAIFTCELRAYNASRLFCYGPEAIRKAYGLDALIAAGYTGVGQTIVIIDAFGSPTVAEDLATFDATFGLPAPPSFTVIRMPGSTPFDYTDGNQLGWAEETSLDVQWAHAIAPGAKIVLVTAVDNSDSAILDAQNYAIDHKLGFIISESFGESELALLQDGAEGKAVLDDNEKSYKRAGNRDISVLVSSGDDGSSGTDLNGDVQPFPVANYPASSPNVTSVGGTNLFFGTATNADPNGTYQGEAVWNDGFGAGGGGVSGYFARPDWQEDVVLKGSPKRLKSRGYPDVAYNAGVEGGVLVFLGFLDTAFGPGNNGFYIFGGTSAGAPQWSGVVAIANQKAREPLGFLNERIYGMGKKGLLGTLMHDVTVGTNSLAGSGIPGYSATPGFDLATGWGTPNSGFIQSLIKFDD
jgi:subtilase family serine protease